MSIKLVVACAIDRDEVNSQSLSVSLEMEQTTPFVIDPANLDDHFRHLCEVVVQALTDDLHASRNIEENLPHLAFSSSAATDATSTDHDVVA